MNIYLQNSHTGAAGVDISDIAYILPTSGRRHRKAPIGAQRSSRPRTAQPPSPASAASSSARFGRSSCLMNDGVGASSSEPAAQQTAHGSGVRVTVELQAILIVQLRPGELLKVVAVAASGKSTALLEFTSTVSANALSRVQHGGAKEPAGQIRGRDSSTRHSIRDPRFASL